MGLLLEVALFGAIAYVVFFVLDILSVYSDVKRDCDIKYRPAVEERERRWKELNQSFLNTQLSRTPLEAPKVVSDEDKQKRKYKYLKRRKYVSK